MNIRQLLNRIRNRTSSQPELSDEVVLKFINVLENIEHDVITCGEMYDVLDQFVENEVKGGSAHALTPLIRDHLDMCSECCDEYEALLAIVEQSNDNTKN
jgi:hypothetical protein